MNSKLHKSWKVWALAAVFLAAVLLAALYFSFKPAASEGSKQIFLEVIGREGDSSSWEVRTDEKYLEQAMEEMEGLSFSGSRIDAFGLMILTVNGEEADPQKDNAYWALYLEDTPCSYGVSSQPIEDGQHYRLVYEPLSSWGGES